MHRPVLVTPPAAAVSLQEAKAHLRVEHEDDDLLIEGLVAAAVSHLDGWTGILGACVALQEWRQDFDRFARCLPLPTGPVTQIKSVTWRTPDGTLSTIASANYSLVTDAGGRSMLRFKDSYVLPSDPLHESRAVAVTYECGHDPVPAALKVAIMLMVGNWYENREAVVPGSAAELPLSAKMLIAPFQRVKI